MSEVPLYGGSSKNLKHLKDATNLILAINVLSSDNVFQETSARHRAVEPEQWLQRHPEAARPGCPGLAGLRTHRVCKNKHRKKH